METAWTVADPPDPAATATVAGALEVPAEFARLLVRRGFDTPASATSFLYPDLANLADPSGLKDLDRAVDRVRRALESGERLLVHGDYDVDGTTATALLVRVLRSFGAGVEHFIPHRIRDGYGLSNRAIDYARSKGVSLIITADCGIGALEPVAYANTHGIDTVVTDHHEVGASMPDAIAVVNPKRPDCEYPFKDFAGVGVAFKLLEALVTGNESATRTLHDNLDLVALGTIADVVPLQGENRVLAQIGLERLSSSDKVGVRALLDAVGLGGRRVDSGHVAFVIAPRINAAGRLGDSETGIRLLLSEDAEESKTLAATLERNNVNRRKIDEAMLEEAIGMVEALGRSDRAEPLVLWSSDWHSGVLGIVASRLVERYRVPAVLMAVDDGEGRGSGRSISGFDLVGALSGCNDLLEEWGGHKYAAGLTIRTTHLETFRERFIANARGPLSELDRRPRLHIEEAVRLKDSDRKLALLCERLAPFGYENPEPMFVCHELQLLEPPRRTGDQGQHLRLTAYQEGHTRECIAFGLGDRAESISQPGQHFSLVFVPTINRYRGRESVQLKVKDLKTD